MRLPPIFLVLAAGLVTFGAGQMLTPAAHAKITPAVPALRVSVQSLHTKQTAGGVEVTGRLVNTGQQALSYPAVMCIFSDAAGMEVGRADGYFTAGPVESGQSVAFRAFTPKRPIFAAAALRLREAGQVVTVQASDSRRTTAR